MIDNQSFMGHVSFVLKEPKSVKKTSIVLIFRYSNQTVKIYTKQSIEPVRLQTKLDNPYVSLNVDYLQSVNCYFDDKNNKELSQLSKGQKVEIIGTCRGLTLTDVVVKDCELWEQKAVKY